MSTETSTSLRMSRVIKADRETVWAAWTEIEQMRQWMAPEGVEMPTLESDLSVGGRFHLGMRNAEGAEFNAYGTYTEIDRPNRLAYTWRWKEPAHDCGETMVTVELNDLNGSTEVVLTHDGFPTADAKDNHMRGWTSCFNGLEALFA